MDSSVNPANQASFNRLIAALEGKTAEFDQIIAAAREEVAQFGTVSRESIAQQQAQARQLSAAKPVQTGTGTVRQTTASVQQLATAEAEVNKLLTQQIELRMQAAAAAREQLAAVGGQAGAGAGAAAGAAPVQRPSSSLPPIVNTAQGPKIQQQQAAADAKAAEQAIVVQRARIGAATGTNELTGSTQKLILTTSQANNVLQRHGALTTEFIQAAARGQVTVREFGSQIGQTVAKFGGWTAAAAGVYGTLGALTELVRGSLDASNAVQNLSRTVETGFSRPAAGQALIGLAHETNTSMKEAGDAAFLFSRTFHSTADATYVAGLALKAYKLDGVSVTDQVRAMTAIHQQFKVTAQGMGPVWGLLANGQREFNARTNEMVPAMIGSMTAVKNAGGDLTDYIKILQIALRTTQLTGAQLGTAFRRAPTFLNRPTSQAALRSLGFDPEEAINHFTDFFQKVMKRAPHMSGADRRTLFQGIFGPQFGQRMAGLSTVDPKLMQQIMGQSVGSSAPLLKEFSKLLGTPEEQLKMLVNNVQQLGAELGQSGVLAPLGMVVKMLNSGLSATTQLLKAFAALPAPLREAATYLGVFAGLRGLTGRLNIGGIPGFSPSPNAMLGKQISSGLTSESMFYQEQYASTSRNAAVTSLEADQAKLARDRAAQAQMAGDETVTEDRIEATQKAYEDALGRVAMAEARMAALKVEQLALQERTNLYNAGIAEGLSAEQAYQRAGGQYTLNTLERGKVMTSPAVVAVPGSIAAERDAANAAAAGETAAGAASAAAASATTGATAASKAAAAGSASLGAAASAGAAVSATASSTTAVTTTRITRWAALQAMYARQIAAEDEAMVASTEAAAAAGTTVGIAGAQVGVTTATGAVAGLGAVVGKLALPLLGLGVAAVALNAGLQHADDALKATREDLKKTPKSIGDVRSEAEKLTADAQSWYKAGGPAAGIGKIPVIGAPVVGAGEYIWQHLLGGNPSDLTGGPNEAARIFSQMWERRHDFTKQVQVGSYQETQGGWPVSVPRLENQRVYTQGPFDKLYQQAKQDTATIPKTLAGRDQWAAEQKKLEVAAAIATAKIESTVKTPEGLKGLALALSGFTNVIQGMGKDLYQSHIQTIDSKNPMAQFGNMKPETIVSDMQAITDRMSLYGSSTADLQKLAYAYAFLSRKFMSSHDDKELQLVMQAQTQMTDAVRADVQGLIDAAAAATSKSEKKSDLAAARAEIKTGTLVMGQAFAVADAQIKIAGLTLKETEASIAFLEQAIAQTGQDAVNAWTSTPHGKSHQAVIGGIPVTTSSIVKALKAQEQAMLGKMNALGKGNKAFDTAMNQLTASINSAAKSGAGPTTPTSQDPYNIARLQSEIAQAQAEGDPVRQAQIAEQFAGVELRGAKNQNERLQAQLDMVQAENQYWSAVEQRTQSYYSYLESSTTDPLKIARYQKKAADEAVQNALAHGGPNTQTYYEAKAKQNQAAQNLVQQQIQQREDSIDFNLTMQRISTQTAIQEYRALLNVHGITKQLRRQVLEKIKQLKDAGQSEFAALDLGTIRMPTPYEIRRAVMGLRQQAMSNVTNHYNTTINADGPAGATAVGVVMDRYHSGTGKAISRATGTR